MDPSGGSVALTRQDFGGYWPLEADEILLVCEPVSDRPAHHILAVVGGKTYALNGTARGSAKKRGWGDFDSLIAAERDPSGSFSIEAIQFRLALVDRGLALCR